ncbi:MAG: sulfatase-like hydrolase/transferase, partial [Planctomycetota bacterium]
SLLTGLFPRSAGVRVNGDPLPPADLPTLPMLFQQKGSRTGAFIAAFPLDSTFGLDRGFDRYDDELSSSAERDGDHIERPGNEVVDSALSWLGERSREPFFAWVHLFDPHWPYEPPPPYDERLAGAYDGEIAFADAQVGRLLAWIDEQGLRERTLVVVAGDHGEAFGEHGELQHGHFVYDTTMRVPLLMRLPSRVPAGTVVDAAVGLVDLYPTIVEQLGWDLPGVLDGRALQATWTSPSTPRPPVYAETESPRRGFGWAPLACLVSSDWKYIRAPRPELYDRRADPEELNNLIGQRPEIAGRMREQLDSLVAGMEPRFLEGVTLDTATRRRLESLGYLTGGRPDAEDAETGADPKDMVQVDRDHSRAVALLMRGEARRTIELVEPLVAVSPQSDSLHATLGVAYLATDRLADAERAFTASLRIDSAIPDRLAGLGEARRRQNRLEEAIDAFQQALVIDPELVEARRGLGLARAAQGDWRRALVHFQRWRGLKPDDPAALFNCGSALIALERAEEAERLLRKARELDPSNRMVHRSYCQSLMAQGRRVDAIDALVETLVTLPDDPEFQCMAAWLAATTDEPGSLGPERMIELAGRCRDTLQNARGWDVVAAAHADAGQYDQAIAAAERGLEIAAAQGDQRMLVELAERLALYRADRPFREATVPPGP